MIGLTATTLVIYKSSRILHTSIYIPELCVGHLEGFSDGAPEVYLFRSALRKGAVGEVGQLLDVLYPHVHPSLHKEVKHRQEHAPQEARCNHRANILKSNAPENSTSGSPLLLFHVAAFHTTCISPKFSI